MFTIAYGVVSLNLDSLEVSFHGLKILSISKPLQLSQEKDFE
jgi:hypothetical protein